jgi:L-ascorbate metabolism protein UlaG (beta-lactamase superfamily)
MSSLAGRLDVALLPVTGWGRKVGPGHLTPETAAHAAAALRPRVAIPIHWGTLASRGALWLADPEQPARAFADHAAAVAPSVEVRVIPPGATTAVLATGNADER